MSTLDARTAPPTANARRRLPPPLRWALGALAVGTVSSIAYAAIAVFTTTTSSGDDAPFRYTADYWFTGMAIPMACASIVLLTALCKLRRGRVGRLALAGVVLNNVALCVLIAELAYSIAIGAEATWGGTYVVATAATFVGHALYSAGSWRAGLLPRWLLGIWPVVWVIGSFAATGATPLLLVALYAVVAVLLTRRVRAA